MSDAPETNETPGATPSPPARWTRRMRIRAHDLDSTGLLGPVGLMRMVETMRWDVFAGDLRGSFSRAVVRAQSLQMMGGAGYGQQLELSMWVARVGRSSIALAHEVHLADMGLPPIAGLSATIVATTPEGRPAEVGPVARGFLRAEDAWLVGKRDFNSPPADCFVHELGVQQHDLDLLQHVNQARYADFANSARYAAAAAGAFPAGFDGGRPLRRLDLAYDDEARMGAQLQARTWHAGEDRVGVELSDAEDGRVLNRAELELQAS